MDNCLYFVPKSGTIEVSQTTQSAAMYRAFGAMSQVFEGDLTMSDFNPDCVLIPLSKTGKYAWQYTAIVSPEDAVLADLNWTVDIISGDLQYARRAYRIGNNQQVDVSLHRAVLERELGRLLAKSEIADHINMNGLDCRRENLRIANKSQNSANRRKSRVNVSGYKGVQWNKTSSKWQALIKVNQETFYLGSFDDPVEAHKAYCEAAKIYFGDFANSGE